MTTEPGAAAGPAVSSAAVSLAATILAAPAGPASTARSADAWAGSEAHWDIYFAVVLAGTLALVQVAGPQSESARLVASVALAAMVPWYVFVGRRVMHAGYGATPAWLGTVYLAGLVPLLALAESGTGTDTFILLALCPQCFMAVSYWRAIAAVVAMNGTQVVIALARGESAVGVGVSAGIAALGIAFSIAFGTWIIRIINQSAERAELIAQLEQTRAELARANREAGIMAERDRLASEIHDTLAQGFTSIVMLVQAADAIIDSDPAQARKQLDLVAHTARENLAEARALVAGLTPAALASATLADAVARLTERGGQELGIAAEFSVCGEPRWLGTGAEVMLLRVCQEAIANVRKHATAGSMRVRLTYTGDSAVLEVSDDGVGFDPALTSPGYGLRGMRARVTEIGGTLTVRSVPGEGTTVSVETR